MPAFRYKHGDKPLDGYVIQRGVGRGGFGEVYYAISDSGREVALKVIQGYEQIELRGVSQCMNLKSPHLVTIFDVRHSAEDIPFVIMEYVAGPSLRELIDQQPAGLGIQKAAFFLREIGKGLTFLHDCGIVHRDLKPGNIFYENGLVKIGDYGLSKAMSASQHSGQTVTVGTVHYMAPEIGLGRYDRSIDIYAMGAVLFEMITGQVPYLGASAGEILMKHMSSEPNVSAIEEPFATVIKKAMARDPALRYQTVQEMVEAVFGAEHVRESVSGFSPGDLSMVAQRVAGRIAVGVGGSSGPPMPPIPREQPDSWQANAFADRPNRVSNLATPPPLPIPVLPAPAAVPLAAPAGGAVIQPDPIPPLQRYILAGATILVIALASGAVAPSFDRDNFPIWMFFSLLAMVGGVAGMVISRRWLLHKVPPEAGFVQRLAVSAPATVLALLLVLPVFAGTDSRSQELIGRTWGALILPLMILNWVKWTAPHRVTRISLAHALLAGAFGFGMTALFGGSLELGVAILAGIALASSVVFPWTPRMFSPPGSPLPIGLLPALHAAQAARSPRPVESIEQQRAAVYNAPTRISPRPIPDGVRWIWRGGFALILALGVVLIGVSQSSPNWHGTDQGVGGGFGAGLIVLGLVCFFQSFRRQRAGWWSYLIKPLVLYACLQAVLLSAFILGAANLPDEETGLAIFFIIFPALLFLMLLSVRGSTEPRARSLANPPAGSPPPLPAAAQYSPAPAFEPLPQSASPYASAAAAPAAVRYRRREPLRLRFLATFLGLSLHAATLLLALVVAIDIPGFIEAGLADPRMANDMQRELGAGWARLLQLQGYILTYVLAFAATAFLMLGRRSSGILHMVRPILAAVCFLAAMYLLDTGLSGTWQAIYDKTNGRLQEAQSIAQYLDAARAKYTIISLLFALAGLALLLWPAPQSKSAREPAPEDGVS